MMFFAQTYFLIIKNATPFFILNFWIKILKLLLEALGLSVGPYFYQEISLRGFSKLFYVSKISIKYTSLKIPLVDRIWYDGNLPSFLFNKTTNTDNLWIWMKCFDWWRIRKHFLVAKPLYKSICPYVNHV